MGEGEESDRHCLGINNNPKRYYMYDNMYTFSQCFIYKTNFAKVRFDQLFTANNNLLVIVMLRFTERLNAVQRAVRRLTRNFPVKFLTF